MALWRADDGDKEFDDGLTAKPGEEGFTRELAQAEFGDTPFSYVGTPNWKPTPIPDEAKA
jgi:hypothetical protein